MYRPKVFVFAGIVLFTAAAAIGQMTPSNSVPAQGAVNDCSRSLLFNFDVIRNGESVRQIPIWGLPANSVFFFDAGMTIDADGAPNAYNADDTALDELVNAGEPGHWQGVIQDEKGDPYVQGQNDPFPGYYISCTALFDRTKDRLDTSRYVDASKIPYVVLPGDAARQAGARLGDFAVVFNLRNGKSSYAIFADIGTLGEGSVALANNLGIRSDARDGGTRQGIRYLVFPGSGNGQPRSLDEISSETERYFRDWGGAKRIQACPLN